MANLLWRVNVAYTLLCEACPYTTAAPGAGQSLKAMTDFVLPLVLIVTAGAKCQPAICLLLSILPIMLYCYYFAQQVDIWMPAGYSTLSQEQSPYHDAMSCLYM